MAGEARYAKHAVNRHVWLARTLDSDEEAWGDPDLVCAACGLQAYSNGEPNDACDRRLMLDEGDANADAAVDDPNGPTLPV